MKIPDADKNFDIIVNGTDHAVPNDEVSFDAVVDIAYPDGGRGPLITYTVDFYNGGGRPTEGKLTQGQSAKVKDGTVFNVTRTDRS
ncbi:MAG: multiubiquitin domain-containing protein [Gemmatimonadota bacterium]|nr:multiubiquitin domain-containing protein [Gemmatimonadota bacterium]